MCEQGKVMCEQGKVKAYSIESDWRTLKSTKRNLLHRSATCHGPDMGDTPSNMYFKFQMQCLVSFLEHFCYWKASTPVSWFPEKRT
jgi:hypothetical protein